MLKDSRISVFISPEGLIIKQTVSFTHFHLNVFYLS